MFGVVYVSCVHLGCCSFGLSVANHSQAIGWKDFSNYKKRVEDDEECQVSRSVLIFFVFNVIYIVHIY